MIILEQIVGESMLSHKIIYKSLMKKWAIRSPNGLQVYTYSIENDAFQYKKIKSAYADANLYNSHVEKLLSDKVETILGDFSKKIYNVFHKGLNFEYKLSEIMNVLKALALMNMRNPNLQPSGDLDINASLKVLIENLEVPDFLLKPKFLIIKNSTEIDFVMPSSFTIGVLPTNNIVNQFFPLSPQFGILLSNSKKYLLNRDYVIPVEVLELDMVRDMNYAIIEIERKKGFYKEIIGNDKQLNRVIEDWKNK